MEKQKTQSPDKRRRDAVIFLLLLLLLGLGFFLRNAHLQLAADDVGWLRGEAPTVFDQYRYIPRFFLVSLYALFGPSPVAALAMIFLFHFANSLLVGRLSYKLLNSQIAAKVATFVFLINPITLSTLTWISCFSYVLGTSLALTSLLAAWKGSAEDTDKPLLWWLVALACYGAGLSSSHEIFFLPVLFLLFDWLRRGAVRGRGTVSFAVAMLFAVLIHFFVYDFGRYGVETIKLFTPGFISAFASSALSFGLSLGLAYPLSFFVKTLDFLRVCFAEPPRWGMTLVLLAGGILFYEPNKTWRVRLVMALSFAALITPYIIRLYLTPDKVSYHISYVLSGRVFYLPFTIIALAWGGIVAKLYDGHAKGRKLTWLLPFLSLAGYLHALLALYDRTDFMGLQVLHGTSRSFPPSWTPYADNQPIWFVGSTLVIIAVAAIRFVTEKLGEKGEQSMKHPRRDLSFTCSRRQFWRALLQEGFVISGSLKGRQGCRLSELGSLPDDQLARVRPIVNPDHEIFMDQGHVWSRCKKTEATLKLFPTEKDNLVAFNLFDGRHTLGEIGERLSQEMDWDKARGFAHARDLFLSLASRLVCVPRDPLEPEE